jgi:hypothetical protein
MKVWVVTNVELGWDCIVGIFDPASLTKQEIEERFPKRSGYIVHWGPHTVHNDFEEFE